MPNPNPRLICELCGDLPFAGLSLCGRCNAKLLGESRWGVRPPQVTKRLPADPKPPEKARSA